MLEWKIFLRKQRQCTWITQWHGQQAINRRKVSPTAPQLSSSFWVKGSLGQYCVDFSFTGGQYSKKLSSWAALTSGCSYVEEPVMFHAIYLSPGELYGSSHTISLPRFELFTCYDGAFPLSLQFSVVYALLKQLLSKINLAVLVLSSATLKSLKKWC